MAHSPAQTFLQGSIADTMKSTNPQPAKGGDDVGLGGKIAP